MTLRLTARTAFAALIVSFLFHNIEEAISICTYPVQSPLSFIKPASCNQFLCAVSIMSFIVIVLFLTAMLTKQPKVYLIISTAIAAGLVLNVLIPHTIIAIYRLDYTPGLVTAILLNLPLGLFTLLKNRPNFTSKIQFYRFIGIGLVVGYLIFALVMVLVKQSIK
jgi:hypothetical protein